MKILVAAIAMLFPFKTLASCEVLSRQAEECVKGISSDDLEIQKDSLSLSIECNRKRALCIQECSKNTKDAEDNRRYLECKGSLADQQTYRTNKLKRTEEQTDSTMKNPAAPQGGLDFKKTGEGGTGGVIQYKILTNPNRPSSERGSSGTK